MDEEVKGRFPTWFLDELKKKNESKPEVPPELAKVFWKFAFNHVASQPGCSSK